MFGIVSRVNFTVTNTMEPASKSKIDSQTKINVAADKIPARCGRLMQVLIPCQARHVLLLPLMRSAADDVA